MIYTVVIDSDNGSETVAIEAGSLSEASMDAADFEGEIVSISKSDS